MIVVVQRVASASVDVPEGDGSPHHSAIGRGALALVGVERGDDESVTIWCADKLAALRIFPDEEGRMNRSLVDIGAEALVVSQFTLVGETRKGTRPSFTRAAPPEEASPLVDAFAERLRSAHGLVVGSGVFGASMQVALVNDGPVTLIIERRAD